jgi:hypothetical protein
MRTVRLVFAKLDKLGAAVPRGRPTRDALYLRLDTQIVELWYRLGGLPTPEEAAGIWRDIWYEEAHHSTAIEGNTLVRKQVEQLLAEGRAVGNKELKEYLEVRGYADAAQWVYAQAHAQPAANAPHQQWIDLTEVRRVHTAAMSPVWDVAPHPDANDDETPGAFRRHDIHPFPGGMTPPSWVLVQPEMTTWVDEVNAIEPRGATFAEAIARAHCRFEQIHPFLDGNGRTGRLVLNLVLVRMGYPPAIVFKNQRNAYLRALRRADADDFGLLAEFLARAILDNLYRFIVPAVAGPAKIVPIRALERPGLTEGALRAAAVRGTLQATKGADGQWRSTQKWVDEYAHRRQRRS